MNHFIFKAVTCVLVFIGTIVIFPFHTAEDNFVPDETLAIVAETSVTEPPEAPETTEETIVEPTLVPSRIPTEIPTEVIYTEEEVEVEETEPEFVSYYTYTEEELDLLARLIYSEGGGESYETKLKIGSVVMNRVDDPDFPDTIRGVIYQKGQFSVTTYRIDGVIMIDRPADEESRKAAKEILDYGSILPSDVQVFYAVYCKEGWVTSRATYEVSDRTVFAYIYSKKG